MYSYEIEHLEQLRKYLADCTVLLKKDGTFPLENPGKIAVFGNAARHTIKGGTGSGEVNSRFFVNIEEALDKTGFEIVNRKWLDEYDNIHEKARIDFINEVKAEAKKKHTQAVLLAMGRIMKEPEYELSIDYNADTAIYCVGRKCGEGNDRKDEKGDFRLTDTEIRDILSINEKYEKFMLVINTGGPVDLSPVKDVKNILILSQLGVETGYALTDILLGKSNPSGKLATTWTHEYCKDGQFGELNDTEYNEGIFVGYRYFDSADIKADYPFGYGLSYTDFSIGDIKVENKASHIQVHCSVTNTGKFNGKEVVQAYLSFPNGKIIREYQSLAGFEKTKELAPKEKENLTIEFDLADSAYYDEEKAQMALEKGIYILRVGNSSVDNQPIAVIELKEDVVLKQLKNILNKVEIKEKSYQSKKETKTDHLEKIELTAEDFAFKEVCYDKKIEIREDVKKMSDQDLCYLSIGSFNPKGGLTSMIGNASRKVCGAAGDTPYMVKEVPSLSMADGSSGVRVIRRYYEDAKGMHPIGEVSIPQSIVMFLPPILQKLQAVIAGGKKEAPKGVEVKEQYATALPISCAVAQSFSKELAYLCGDIVGDEMSRFNVDLWLAPALNIHRNILCGRNFEYYSEDPLVSGVIAGYVSKGVQSHKGRGVTIKHFAANNQETNRTNNNSVLSERTFREIYLRGFEIAMRIEKPHALMTSYNLINGVHTAEHYGLIHDCLRMENQYEGIIMTDWIVKGTSMVKVPDHPQTVSTNIAKNGGNLMMPGSKEDFEILCKAFKEGKISRAQLEENASYLLNAIDHIEKA